MTSDQIVLGYTPSHLMKDWQLRFDTDLGWFYEPITHFYDTGCKKQQPYCSSKEHHHSRKVGHEPYYNMKDCTITDPPRIFITHRPKKGEWEEIKTTEDLFKSALFVRREGV